MNKNMSEEKNITTNGCTDVLGIGKSFYHIVNLIAVCLYSLMIIFFALFCTGNFDYFITILDTICFR